MRMLMDPKAVSYGTNSAIAIDVDFSCPTNSGCNPGCYSCTPAQAQE